MHLQMSVKSLSNYLWQSHWTRKRGCWLLDDESVSLSLNNKPSNWMGSNKNILFLSSPLPLLNQRWFFFLLTWSANCIIKSVCLQSSDGHSVDRDFPSNPRRLLDSPNAIPSREKNVYNNKKKSWERAFKIKKKKQVPFATLYNNRMN